MSYAKEPRKIALVGIGKIARDQHVPALAASPDWDLAATVSRKGGVEGIEAHEDFDAFLEARPDIEVVSLCLPPQPRFDYAKKALLARRHVMLEKPPGQTLAEMHELERLAAKQGVTLYASWHSRMAAGVAAARSRLVERVVQGVCITWKEDVRKWHPGQDWVFAPGGMGVMDPGINALSILTEILPEPVHLVAADLEFPENRDTPIAARLEFSGHVSAVFDWRQEGPQTWDIEIETNKGPLALREGGARLEVDGAEQELLDHPGEYPSLYARMAELVGRGESDVDLAPMIHVADAMTLGRRVTVAPFEF
ncbi:Gfo/Idh/MocA family protein [Limimaricola cinnabarinus]|jgi:D-galactose 1-dehydrogenase|uniref:D-galactose 1-dehydrogenase n=1 Tax=Limimaricola cinnabarinus TaxID=1125964 RepID=A0A2G1MJI0_9RHOB|nr:Gfo/Idh/MocA family oxidoreductase [Limimaricola cinnabarinus]PHP28903.1 D-galactose 1-dehydrogenase [Limimaricola cinnabarinus]